MRLPVARWLYVHAPRWLARWWVNRVLNPGLGYTGYWCPHGWKAWVRRGNRNALVLVSWCPDCDGKGAPPSITLAMRPLDDLAP